MRHVSVLVVLAGAAAATVLPGQSPLATMFGRDNAGANGGLISFDLHVFQAVAVTALDCNFGQPPGTTGSVDLYVVPGTIYGNELNAAAWTQRGTAAVAATAGVDQPSRATFAQPLEISAGWWGVALICSPNLNHEYTNAWHLPYFRNLELGLEPIWAQHVPFTSSPLGPRIWNGAIHYTVPTAPTSSQLGVGCNGLYGLRLGVSALPSPGSQLRLDTSYVPTTSLFGATVFGLVAFPSGIPLQPLGMPGCHRYVSLDAVLSFVPTATLMSVPLTVPPGFPGLHVYCQSFAFDPLANPFGAVTSNAIDLAL